MIGRAYQACYTRIGKFSKAELSGDRAVHEGYQNVNCSPDMPGNLGSIFDNRRKIVSPNAAEFQKNHVLGMFCENDVWGVERLRFDGADENSRKVFFDQTFLLPNAYELLRKPEQLIYISDSNFGTNVEETGDAGLLHSEEGVIRQCLRSTAAIRDSLEQYPQASVPESTETILAKYGIEREWYEKLVKCVYFQLFTTNAATVVYVRTDGTASMMRDLLYLIMAALPLSLRTRLSAGEYSYNNQKGCNLYFTALVPPRQAFVDPVGKDQNILNDKQWEMFDRRYPYITSGLMLSGNDRPRYWQGIEVMMESFGAGRSSRWQCLQLAYRLLNGDQSDPDSAPDLLYDLLGLPVEQNSQWEHYVTELLQQTIRMGVRLPEATEERLTELLQSARSGEYADTLMDYEALRLEMEDTGRAGSHLLRFSDKDEKFLELRKRLYETERGQEILHDVYLQKARDLVRKEGLKEEDLIRAAAESADLDKTADIMTMYRRKALDLAVAEVEQGTASFRDVERRLAWVLGEIGEVPGEYSDMRLRYALRRRYDEQFWKNFDAARYESGEYEQFYRAFGREFPASVELLGAIRGFDQGDDPAVFDYLRKKVPQGQKEKTGTQFVRLFREREENGGIVPIYLWRAAAFLLGTSTVPLMVQSEARLLFDEDELDMELDRERNGWNDKVLLQVMDEMEKIMKEDKSLKKQLKDNYDILNEECRIRGLNHKKGFLSGLFG